MLIEKMKKKLKEAFSYINNDRGSAMITSLVVGLVVLIFCLSMLLVTYSLYAQTNRQTTQLQCKNLAQTFSEELSDELSDKDSDIYIYLTKEIVDQLSAGDSGTDNKKAHISMELRGNGEASNPLSFFTIEVVFEAEDKRSVEAEITCIRGSKNDRDVQSYTLTRSYDL